MNKTSDLIIIGGGPAGYAAALRSAELGQKVSLIEKEGLGGVCLLAGCIPTKILTHHLKLLKKIKNKKDSGINGEAVIFSWPELLKYKNTKIKNLSLGLEALFKKNKIDLISGMASLKGSGQVAVGDQILEADKIILATGSRPIIPASFSYDGKSVLSAEDALNLETVPAKMVIIGGGAQGVEWATIYSLLGSQVILLEAFDQILPAMDGEIVRQLVRQLEKQKVKIITGTPVEKIVRENSSESGGLKIFLKNGEILVSDMVMVSLGRRALVPKTENFSLETEKGFLKISKNLETSAPGIFAAGDLTGPPLLAHRASWQGKKLAEFLAGKVPEIPETPMPFCIFSFLEAGAIGLTQKDAEAQNIDFGVVRLPFSALGIAQALEENDGLVKVIYEKTTRKILGIHLAGEHASFILGQAVTLVNCGATLDTLENLVQAHPTFPEILGSLPEFNWIP